MSANLQHNWSIYDPDSVLDRTDLELVYAREDILQCTHKQTGVIVDLGYYRDSTNHGCWILRVIGHDLDWEKPLRTMEFQGLQSAIVATKDFLDSYEG